MGPFPPGYIHQGLASKSPLVIKCSLLPDSSYHQPARPDQISSKINWLTKQNGYFRPTPVATTFHFTEPSATQPSVNLPQHKEEACVSIPYLWSLEEPLPWDWFWPS